MRRSFAPKAVIPAFPLGQVRDQKLPFRLAREQWQTCAALFLALGCAELTDPVDGSSSDVANVWEGDDFTVAVDTAGRDRRITYAGVTYLFAVKSVDDTSGVITFVDGPVSRSSWTVSLRAGRSAIVNAARSAARSSAATRARCRRIHVASNASLPASTTAHISRSLIDTPSDSGPSYPDPAERPPLESTRADACVRQPLSHQTS